MRKIPNINTHIFKQPVIPWSVSGFSTEATAAFALYDSLGGGLTTAEKTMMATYIDAEVAALNHSKKDYEVILGLSGTNALVDYIGGTLATNSGATFTTSGAAFAGAEYIDTGFVPSTDGVNMVQDDAQAEAYLKIISDTSDSISTFGGENSFNTRSTNMFFSLGNLFFRINNGVAKNSAYAITAEKLYSPVRTGAETTAFFVNGVNKRNGIEASDGLPEYSFHIGGRNRAGAPGAYFTGTISSFSAGAVLTSQSEHYTNINTLLTALSA